MLEQVLEMTSFDPQTYLTPGEQIIKYLLKLMSGNCRYFVESLRVAAWLAQRQSYRRAYGAIHHISQNRALFSVCNKHMKHGVTYMFFVREYAVQFNTEDFHCGNKEEIVRRVS
jgi:hypothetical protein